MADMMEVFPGISMSPEGRFGKPCIAGTRMDVATVVGLLAAGERSCAAVSAAGRQAQVDPAIPFP